MEPLKKLQQLCDASNRRYKTDQNDDDQVRALFNYAKKENSVCVIIGYDDYNAIEAEKVKNMYKENPDAAVKNEENGFSYIEMNYKRYMIKTSLIQ